LDYQEAQGWAGKRARVLWDCPEQVLNRVDFLRGSAVGIVTRVTPTMVYVDHNEAGPPQYCQFTEMPQLDGLEGRLQHALVPQGGPGEVQFQTDLRPVNKLGFSESGWTSKMQSDTTK
jgi:hypothetical protein